MNNSQLINQTSGKTEYYTPLFIIETARELMCIIDLDPASSLAANERVKASAIYTALDDGLTKPWAGNIWLNHPFGRTTNPLWINKLIYEYSRGPITQACCLTFACTSEKWFQPLLKFPQCFLYPRLNYILPNGDVLRGVTKGSVVTYLGANTTAFRNLFCRLGTVKV